MNSISVAFLLAFVCTVVLSQANISEEHMKVVLGYHIECKEESKVDDGVASGILMGKFADDPALRQHLFCMSKKLGVINDSGEIQKDVLKDMISKVINDEDKINEIVDSCAVEKDSPEETAFQLTKCTFETTHPK